MRLKSVSIPAIGDRPISLVSHLRNVAYILRTNPAIYSWTNRIDCNAGLLLRSALSLSRDELRDGLVSAGIPNSTMGTWAGCVAAICPINPSLSSPEFFKKITKAGIRHDDIAHIEHLSHPEILKAISRTTVETKFFGLLKKTVEYEPAKEKASDVADYFEAWAEKIQAFHADKGTAPEVPTSAALDLAETRPLV